jgi:DNA-binding NarL/FixJ family response regulator
MKAGGSILTKEEIEVLLLAGTHPNGQHLSNTEIARRLHISVSKVKILIHQACAKLHAHNRIEAMFFALIRGEIRVDEIYTLDEIAEMMSALHPDVLRRITYLVCEELEYGYLPWKEDEIISTHRKQDNILTKREQDVLILAGRGLTNREIADTLYMCTGTIRTFLYRACTKLGARNRLDAVVLALKRGDVLISEILSPSELLDSLAPLGIETLEEIARLRDHNFGQGLVSTGN